MRIVAGAHRGRKLLAPAGIEVRPTSERTREALFSHLQQGQPPLEGARFLDLFAGTGAVALEAASRGAAAVMAVELSAAALEVLGRNLDALGERHRVTVHRADATRLGRAADPFDIAFMDPPYRQRLVPACLGCLQRGGWLAPGARVIAEVETADDTILPPGWHVRDRRRHGRATLLFLGCGDPRD